MGLDPKIKSLICVGSSITANCQPCLKIHAEKARENGAADAEIREAVALGKSVRKGSATKMDEFTAVEVGAQDE
ncbi:MAG: carboxymuconolactone decarboxylase family protein [Deltaproteobacteria bacterium]|nr:carboxymuconolactone decarboxylase family protein [Deltaproteobacteria bacterium]